MKKTILSAFAFLFLAQSAQADIEFAKAVPKDQRKQLVQDMYYMANQPWVSDTKLLQLMDLTSNDGLTVLNWIDNRVRYVVPETFELNDKTIYQISDNYFPTPSEVPSFEQPANTPSDGGSGGNKVMTIMSNYGGAVYVIGKMQHSLLGVKIDDKKIPVTSTRIGILKVGSGLFAADQLLKVTNDSEVARHFRLATLVHEARHSDGRGTSAGFLHAICPEGHRLAGFAACDRNSNGPYTVGAQFEFMTLQNCKACSETDKEMLNKMAVDSYDRVISPMSTVIPGDSADVAIISTYQMLLQLCQSSPKSCTAEDTAKYRQAIAEAQARLNPGPPQVIAAPVWDANPEGTFPTISRDQSWIMINNLNSKN
jgi:hypothetical protein